MGEVEFSVLLEEVEHGEEEWLQTDTHAAHVRCEIAFFLQGVAVEPFVCGLFGDEVGEFGGDVEAVPETGEILEGE